MHESVWIVFNMLNENGYRQMFLMNVVESALPLPLSISGQPIKAVEKNWTPFVFNEKLHFIYSFSPLVILSCDRETGICSATQKNQSLPSIGQYRGGTPALQIGSNVFQGFLHITRGLNGKETFDREELPLPAR